MESRTEDQAAKHTIPVIDRMMEVLTELERHAGGLTIRELTGLLTVPRTTIYRILNTLQGHEVVRRGEDGSYQLGRRLLSLAAHTTTRFSEANLVAACQPTLERLAAELGEGVKLNVLADGGVLVLAAAQGRREYALTVAAGQRMPIHSGAAGKVLLAYAPDEAVDFVLSGPLPAYTGKTLTDPRKLRAELSRIKRLGWGEDRGESAPSIQAFAAPVSNGAGTVIAALSVPYLAGTSEARMEDIRDLTIRTASALSEALRG